MPRKGQQILGKVLTPQRTIEDKKLELEGYIMWGAQDTQGTPAWPAPSTARSLGTRMGGLKPYVLLLSTRLAIPALPGQEGFTPDERHLHHAMQERTAKVNSLERVRDKTTTLLIINTIGVACFALLLAFMSILILPSIISSLPFVSKGGG